MVVILCFFCVWCQRKETCFFLAIALKTSLYKRSLWDRPAFPCLQWASGRITIFLAEKYLGALCRARRCGRTAPCACEAPTHTLYHQRSVHGVLCYHPELRSEKTAFKKTKQRKKPNQQTPNHLPLSIKTFLQAFQTFCFCSLPSFPYLLLILRLSKEMK